MAGQNGHIPGDKSCTKKLQAVSEIFVFTSLGQVSIDSDPSQDGISHLYKTVIVRDPESSGQEDDLADRNNESLENYNESVQHVAESSQFIVGGILGQEFEEKTSPGQRQAIVDGPTEMH